MNILEKFPDKEELLSWYKEHELKQTLNVNNHIHTPYSFSAFKNIPQAVALALEEDVKILGINDFFVCDGYDEFAKECYQKKVFPLFNIEFIGLNKKDQENNIKVNDPNNPGRTYFSGKGLNYPENIEKDCKDKLESVKKESQKQVSEMLDKINILIAKNEYDFSLSMGEIFEKYAKNLVRERHIATALRNKAVEMLETESKQIDFFTKIFDNNKPKASLDDIPGFENEIRSRLLKTGGAAFVEENEKAFLDIAEVKDIIIKMGGIPTYPLLLDDKNGNFTDFENNKQKLASTLKERGIYSIELIPNRNSLKILKEYVEYFYEQGFVVSFGTEHNTPALTKMIVDCRDNVELDESMKTINYNGAALLAAHQYLNAKGEQAYILPSGEAKIKERSEFEILGKAIFAYFLKN